MENIFLQEYLDLNSLKGALHSSITINRLIDDEINHDHYVVRTEENASLNTMSSGQQKKALLSYLISQNPQYMILDDVYSNIDKDTKQFITTALNQLAKTTILIQLFFRRNDLLASIDNVLLIDENNLIIKELTTEVFKNQNKELIKLPIGLKLPKVYIDNQIDIDPLVKLNNVSVHYGEKKVLNNINWTIKTGEFWQLVGPNGSGKSTLMSIITGDNPRGYGQDMILFGKRKGSGESIWDIKKQIGYFTPSMIEQFKHVDTVENMIISGFVDSVGLYTKPTDLQKNIAKSWIEMLGNGYTNKTFQQLSLGQQRMVMVVRAMVKHPPLLILDEPTIELDDENSQLFIEMINAISREKKIAILYISHRDEKDLKPDKIFELIPSAIGSEGIIKK
ncbi:MAG: ATP-binding cassette domain-containing protein [Paludibacter sp.]